MEDESTSFKMKDESTSFKMDDESTSFKVRISSHGEFIKTPLYDKGIVDEGMVDKGVVDKGVVDKGKNMTFNIYFRGRVGSTVLTRSNTLDTQIICGKIYCNSAIGEGDFYENMTIQYNGKEVASITLHDSNCSTLNKVPDMLLSFDDDFTSGYAYYDKDGIPLSCKVGEGGKSFVFLEQFKIGDVNKKDITLKEILQKIYEEKKGSTIGHIFLSSCLYINPSNLNDIKKNFPEWFECNRYNIFRGYQKELRDNDLELVEARFKISELKDELYIIDKMKMERDNPEKKPSKSQFHINVLQNNVEEEYTDYVFNYLSQTGDNPTDNPTDIYDLNELIDEEENGDNLTEERKEDKAKRISNILIDNIKKEEDEKKEKEEKEIINKQNEITRIKSELTRLKDTRYNIKTAISKCGIYIGEGDESSSSDEDSPYGEPPKKISRINGGGKNNNLKGKKKYKTRRRTNKTSRRTRKTRRRTRNTRRRNNKTPRRTNKTRRRTRKTRRRRT